jgi:hypothetical protein
MNGFLKGARRLAPQMQRPWRRRYIRHNAAFVALASKVAEEITLKLPLRNVDSGRGDA